MPVPQPRISPETTWKKIPGFREYSVSSAGHVRNDDADRLLAIRVNQSGVAYVGLTRHKTQLSKAVALLVAENFLHPHRNRNFDTPINLNGNRTDNRVENLLWRPRWFAAKYHRQFAYKIMSNKEPIKDVDTGEEFDSAWDAAIKYGLLFVEVSVAATNFTNGLADESSYVWPTKQRFRLL